MKVALAADHGGFRLKETIKDFLGERGVAFHDFGCYSEKSCDYIDWGEKAAEKVAKGEFERGILICGTGLGMNIVANKFPGVRAAACYDLYATRQSREHNDCNILVLAGRMTGEDLAREIVNEWLTAKFKKDERYKRRLEKLKKLEQKNFK
ncbi:ribose 5-phosphate isomerase B [Candidatus Aerophobetes bacterium]|nr:ribose 5-phosphate isomerase B [Candidatus Aerophobetes bacterium]